MEAINYYADAFISLKEIGAIAAENGYETGYHLLLELPVLDIQFDRENPMKWWRWSEYKLDDLSLEDDGRKRLIGLKPKTILLLEYYPAWLMEVSQFLRLILEKYGGWVDCEGDVKALYSVENIDRILFGCP